MNQQTKEQRSAQKAINIARVAKDRKDKAAKRAAVLGTDKVHVPKVPAPKVQVPAPKVPETDAEKELKKLKQFEKRIRGILLVSLDSRGNNVYTDGMKMMNKISVTEKLIIMNKIDKCGGGSVIKVEYLYNDSIYLFLLYLK